LDLGPPDVLGRVRRDAPVDVSEPEEATHRRQPPVDRRRRQPAVLHRRAVQLDVRPGRSEDNQFVIGGPLEEHAQIMPVRLQRPAAVPGEERDSRQLRLIESCVRLEKLHHRGRRSHCRHR
jgi:hypothetical protein